MPLKIARYLNIFIVILMAIDLIGASFAAVQAHNNNKTSYHARHSNTSFAFIFFEKEAEEETEKNEEAREKFIGAELVDFSQMAVLLSRIHTPTIVFTNSEQRFLTRPSLFTLHCVLLI